jgi:hypothetical protein
MAGNGNENNASKIIADLSSCRSMIKNINNKKLRPSFS